MFINVLSPWFAVSLFAIALSHTFCFFSVPKLFGSELFSSSSFWDWTLSVKVEPLRLQVCEKSRAWEASSLVLT